MQDNYLNLPSRNHSKHTYRVLTNLYEIRLEKLPTHYYLYTPKPDVDSHTLKLLKNYATQNRTQSKSFYQQIGFICYYQKGFLGNINFNSTFTLQFNEENHDKKLITVVMAKSREVALNELISSQQGTKFMRTALNTQVTRIISSKPIKVTLHKQKSFIFETMRKITLSYLCFNHKIWMSTDSTNRVQEHCTVLDYIIKYKNSESGALLKGAKLVKNYGKMQELYLLEVDCWKNPTHKMDDRSQLTFEQYYLQKYKIAIKDKQQPLIKATRRKKHHPHSPTQYLIPELVSLADKSYMYDCPEHITTQLQQLKNISPQQKEDSISQIIGQLGAEDIIKKAAINLDAQQLTAPYILTKNKETVPEDGVFEFRNAIRQSPELKSWAVAYSTGNSNEKQEVEQLIDYFRDLTRIYGINITTSPSFIKVTDKKWQSWQAALQQNFKNYGKVQIILLFLKEQQEQHYHPLKEYLTLKIKCPSQVICKKSFHSQKCRKPYIIAMDVLLQIMNKIGAIPWDLKRQQNAISQSLVMQGGLTINKDGNGFSFGLVGAAGKQLNQVCSYYKKELITKEDLKNELQICFRLWAKSFVYSCKSPPQTIILYTHTSSQANRKEIRQIQETAFFQLAAIIGLKLKQQNYSPNMAFIYVSTRQKIQFYSKESITSDFILKNVNTGTVVYEQTDSPKSYNFYLTSKTATCTTAKPVKYSVVCNNTNLRREQLSQFTYESCYCYFNYQGAHSIPAMLQNSIKLTKLCRKFTAESKLDDRMIRLHYYL